MDYLTVKEVAELMNCSVQYVKKLCKDNKIQAELQYDPKIKQERYIIPISSLSERNLRKNLKSGILNYASLHFPKPLKRTARR